jgi:hypothetical protein
MTILPDLLVISYKPILYNLVYMTENIRYHKNIRTNHIYVLKDVDYNI